MEQEILAQDDLLQRTGVALDMLREFEREGLLSPIGHADGKVPIYDRQHQDELPKLKALREVGYSCAEIRKIQKRVGIPSGGKRRAAGRGRLLTVGELAERLGVSPRTLKYWEERGLIDPTLRSEGGFRLYTEEEGHTIRLYLDLQNCGFKLDEIKAAADLRAATRNPGTVADASGSCSAGRAAPEETPALPAALRATLDATRARLATIGHGLKRWERELAQQEKELNRRQAELRRRQKKGEGEASGTPSALRPAQGERDGSPSGAPSATDRSAAEQTPRGSRDPAPVPLIPDAAVVEVPALG